MKGCRTSPTTLIERVQRVAFTGLHVTILIWPSPATRDSEPIAPIILYI